jgi:putative membrane protein
MRNSKNEIMKIKKIILCLASVSFLLICSIVYAHGPDEGYPMGPWMWWGHGTGWWIFPLIMIVGMIIMFFLFFGRRGGRSSWCGFGDQKDTETPLDILKKRYAKGEITKEEFDRIKKDL